MKTGERGSFGRITEEGILEMLEKAVPVDKKWRTFSVAVSRDKDGHIIMDQFALSAYNEEAKIEELSNLISVNYIIFNSLNKAAIVKNEIVNALFKLKDTLQEKILKLAEDLTCK